MTSKELASLLGISPRAVRKATLEATKKGKQEIKTKGQTVEFREIPSVGGRGGTAYDYTPQTETETQPPEPEATPKPKTVEVSEKEETIPVKIDLQQLSPAKLAEATKLATICMEYLHRGKMKIDAFLTYTEVEHGIAMTRATLLRKVKVYADAVNAGRDGVTALADTRGRPKGTTKLTQAHKEAILRYMVRRDIRPTDAAIYRNLSAMFDDLPSRETVLRYMEHLKIEKRLELAIAKNPDEAKNKLMPAFGSRSEKAQYPCDYWELDGTDADVVTLDGKRWKVLGLIDIYSRRVAINLEERNNRFAVARNLRAGLLKLGIPDNVVIDNGGEYVSDHIQGCLASMGVNRIKTPPYSGDYKPHIERFFGTMARELFREMEGFVGHNVKEREAIKAGLSYADRLKAIEAWREKQKNADGFAKLWRRSKQYAGLEIEVPLTSDELRAAINAYVQLYEARLHSSIDMSPKMKYESSQRAITRVMDNRSLDFLLGEFKWRSVGKDGIRVMEDGVKFEYAAVELYLHVGKKVLTIQTDELGELACYDENREFLCIAEDPGVKGQSREKFKAASAAWKKAAKEAEKSITRKQKAARELDTTIRDRMDTQMPDMESGRAEKTPTAEQESEAPNRYASSPLEVFLKAIAEGDQHSERIEKLKEKYPEIWEIAQKRSQSA